MKRSLALASAVIVAGVVAGCGSDSSSTEASATEDYCAQLKDAKSEFKSLSGGDFAKMDDAFKRAEEIGKDAPDQVKPDWEVLTGTIGELRTALNDAGLSFKDLGELQSGQMPEGVDQQKLMELGTKMQDFDPAKLQDASKQISKHAKSECGVELGSS